MQVGSGRLRAGGLWPVVQPATPLRRAPLRSLLKPQNTRLLPSQCFRGDAESYVDRLVEASAARPWAENYTGFGRELTPWMEDAPAPALCEALEPSRCAGVRAAVSGTPGRSTGRRHRFGLPRSCGCVVGRAGGLKHAADPRRTAHDDATPLLLLPPPPIPPRCPGPAPTTTSSTGALRPRLPSAPGPLRRRRRPPRGAAPSSTLRPAVPTPAPPSPRPPSPRLCPCPPRPC
jgi:hypothetical protein